MKKILTAFTISAIMFFVFFYSFAGAQTQFVPKTTVQTEQSLIKTAVKTEYTCAGLPVYKSSKGSYFYTRQSKKTGNWYKVYCTPVETPKK